MATTEQWYGNKELFEMITSLDKQMAQICVEMRKIIEAMDEMNAMCQRIEKVESRLAACDGEKKGGKEMWGYIVGGIGVGLAILQAVIK